MTSNAMSPALCFSFCLSRGLDLFGITADRECRCGASDLNAAIWHHHTPRRSLRMPAEKIAVETAEGACPLRVFRYTGHFNDQAIPFELTEGTLQDEAYIDSVVLGRRVSDMSEEHSAKSELHPSRAGIRSEKRIAFLEESQGRAAPGWNRNCWPHDCGPGGGPWKRRRSTLLLGIRGRWQDYAVINYYLDPALDQSRRAAFRQAARAWSSVTCVRFAETATEPPPPSLLVDALNKESCYATYIGYPGDFSYTVVNLGWCDSSRYIGNIIHELGHVLGMNHEQQRPDATHEYHGHGPHLSVHWKNVEEEWKGQYEQDPDSYVGSANDGAGDPHVGYAEYDFGSIMHYPAGDHFDTLPREKKQLTGNRHSLTQGDIKQILDRYQCRLRS